MKGSLTRAEKLAKLKQLKALGKAPEKLLPLTYAQKRFWFLEQLDAKAGINNIFRAHSINGPISVEKFTQAINSILQQHPGLRSRFVEGKDDVKQFSSKIDTIPFEVVSVKNKTELDNAAELDARSGFDLKKVIPCRFKLYQLDEHTAVFTICLHHIIADGFSILLIEKALKSHIQGENSDGHSPYSLSDLLNLQQIDTEKEQSYWQTTLANTDHTISLNHDFASSNQTNNDGAYCYFTLPESLSKDVKDFCQRSKLTPFAFFLSSFNLLMHHLSKQNNFIVGVPELNRNTKQARQMVGALANTLLVPAKIDHSLTASQYVEQSSQSFYQHLAHHKLPYEKLVEMINPERNLSHNPLFQIMFAYNNLNNSASKEAEKQVSADSDNSPIEWQNYGIKRHFSKVDVTLEISEQGATFGGYFEYKTALFSQETIAVWQKYLTTVVEFILKNNTTSINKLQLVDIDQNNINHLQPDNNCHYLAGPVQDIMLAIGKYQATSPEAIALICGETNKYYSYQGLYETYQQIAHSIKIHKISTNSTVAIECTNRTNSIIAMLGCLAANCAFVVLESYLPASRKKYILDDANAAILIKDRAVDNMVSQKIEAHGFEIIKQAGYTPANNSDPKLAYLVYTSGSTGKPKGVKIPRTALSNHSAAVQQFYSIKDSSTILQFSPLSFDLALEEIFPILSAGGKVITRPGQHTLSFDELEKLVKKFAINQLSLPTAYLHSWLNECQQTNAKLPESLKTIVIGTEQLNNETVKQWFKLVSNDKVTLINAYGPSEATISCSAHKVTEKDKHCAVVPIGKPLPCAKLYVLDEQQKPVPAGVIGELYVGGDNLACGYQNLAVQTQQQFIFHSQLQQRLYRTGDNACYNAAGLVQFKGRIDNQIKFRGYRIELDEINNQLKSISGINESVVTLSANHTNKSTSDEDNVELIAYYCASAGINSEEIKQALSLNLPHYMLPSHFIALEALPLTDRGKIDFNALPKLTTLLKENERKLPESPLESEIYTIWQAVLNKNELCCRTSFFTQGGHSLAALQVISRIKEALNKELSLKVFFERPTIIQLSQWLSTAKQQNSMLTILPQSCRSLAPLSQSQSQMWILQQLDGSGASYNMPYVLEFNGNLDITCVEQSLTAITERHDAFKTIYQEKNGTVSQRVLSNQPLAFNQVDLSQHKDAQQQAQIDFNQVAAQPFNLTQAPAYQFTLYTLSNNRFWLAMVVHHINFDGGSLDLFTREFCQCYYQFLQNQDWQPDPLPIQTIDYAHWQQSNAGKEVEELALNYWQDELSGIPEVLDLAHDKVRPAKRKFTGGRCEFELSNAQLKKLTENAHKLGCSNYILALSATTVLLHEYARQEDFAIGIPVSGRLSKDLEPILGLFINSLPIRVQPHGQLSKSELVHQIKQRVLSGFEHQYLPLHKLMQTLDVSRSASHNPLFQVFFNFMHTDGDGHYQLLDDLSLSSPKASNNTARFDLAFTLVTNKNGLKGHIEYSDELFERATIENYCQRLVELLVNFSEASDDKLSTLEQSKLSSIFNRIAPFNNTKVEQASKNNIIEIIIEHARCYPDKPALEFNHQQTSYQELLIQVECYAAYFSSVGIRAGDLVGVYLPRNKNLVITLLALFKCGAAYLPLDPSYPAQRLSYIVEDSKINLVLSEDDNVAFALSENCAVVSCSAIGRNANPIVVPRYQSNNVAYCIYTSGSTGKPKGVEVSQHNLLNFMHAMSQKPGLTNHDKLLALTPISFDISVLELFLPLFNGATLVLLTSEQSRDGQAIQQRLHLGDITHLQGTPASWRLLLEAQWQPCAQLTMLTGGEALPKELAQKLTLNNAPLWNMYGPTETTVWSSCTQIAHNAAHISIGSPIQNTRFYVLNNEQQLASFGSKGQLAIAGSGVTLGYRGQAQLTKERFINIKIPHHCGLLNETTFKEERVYLTGDMVKQSSDGSFTYLQRYDDQVKLRGYRIELGEIEAQVEALDSIESCAVIINNSLAGDAQLIAYYVEKYESNEAEILRQVSQHLPEYMLPTLWTKSEKLPLTPSGKIDKKQLMQQPVDIKRQFVEPETETEQVISNIWQEVLQVNQVGREDGFFKLGGNSIYAMQMLVKLSHSFGLEKITLADLFRHQTVALLAAHIESLQIASCDEEELAALLAELTDK